MRPVYITNERINKKSHLTLDINDPIRNIGGPLKKKPETASIVFTAGRGSRMKAFDGNKTLLPLVPEKSDFEGRDPILLNILENLPPGPKALVVNHRKEEVIGATRGYGPAYFEQSVLNGTGGALMAAREFIDSPDHDLLIITMGDSPMVRATTYLSLIKVLEDCSMMVLGFSPEDKKQYGLLETEGSRVTRIIEWKYWSTFSKERQSQLTICNSGIYAVRKKDLLKYVRRLETNPHRVLKERNGKKAEVKEFFITDLVELMHRGGLEIGYVVAENEHEVMGVDDLPSLKKAQALFREAILDKKNPLIIQPS